MIFIWIDKTPIYPFGQLFLFLRLSIYPHKLHHFALQTFSSVSFKMAEPCNLASHGVPLCHEEICSKPGDDHFESASFSGASRGSLGSSVSNLSDDATSSSPCHPSEPSSASSSMLHLDGEGPLYELSSLLEQLPLRCVYCPEEI